MRVQAEEGGRPAGLRETGSEEAVQRGEKAGKEAERAADRTPVTPGPRAAAWSEVVLQTASRMMAKDQSGW